MTSPTMLTTPWKLHTFWSRNKNALNSGKLKKSRRIKALLLALCCCKDTKSVTKITAYKYRYTMWRICILDVLNDQIHFGWGGRGRIQGGVMGQKLRTPPPPSIIVSILNCKWEHVAYMRRKFDTIVEQRRSIYRFHSTRAHLFLSYHPT